MAVNLNRRRRPLKNRIPAGSLSVIPDPTPAKTLAEKKLKKEKGKDLVASVVVTIADGGTFDNLFRNLPQESEYGRVAVYLLTPGRIMKEIHDALLGEQVKSPIVNKLRADCEEAGPDAVCFNFECCGNYNDSGFASNNAFKEIYLDLIEFLLKDFGCMTMFSDFSLKALIADWDADRFGVKPFVKTGEFAGDLELGFDPDQLKKSPSAQLNTVGSLADNGSAQLKAMGGTILFSLTEIGHQIALETAQTDVRTQTIEPFELQVLTIATKISSDQVTREKIGQVEDDENLSICEIGSKKGLAGHILLTFPPSERNINRHIADLKEQEEEKAKAVKEGVVAADVDDSELKESTPVRGMMLVSCCHWIELMKLDVNMNRLLETVKEEWGITSPKYLNMQNTFSALAAPEQKKKAKSAAVSYVQTRAPAKFNRRNVRKKKFGY